MIELRLPDYEVIIHIQYNSFGKKLEDQILLETKSYELDESTEFEGRKDFHWSFKTWEEALFAGNILKKYCQNPNLLLLKVKTNKTNEKPLIYKG
jgi:hypothetical protein